MLRNVIPQDLKKIERVQYAKRPAIGIDDGNVLEAARFHDPPGIPQLTLLYLRSAKLAPSPAPARADGGVVRDV